MTRRSIKYNIINHENDAEHVHSKSSLFLCNGYPNRSVTRQSSQELLKVQCNGLTAGHRSSKLLSPSGSDVLPLPTTTKRCTRRASASWCGSTRELSQLSPTDSEIENVIRENSIEPNPQSDSLLDAAGSAGITLRPKGQLWMPVTAAAAAFGIESSVEENENKKRCGNCGTVVREPLVKCSTEQTLNPTSNDLMYCGRAARYQGDYKLSQVLRCSDCSFDSPPRSYDEECCIIKKDPGDDHDDNDDLDCKKMKNENGSDTNSNEREASVDKSLSLVEEDDNEKKIYGNKKHASDKKLTSGVTTNHSGGSVAVVSVVQGRRKKLSPEEKLLQDNKEYFKMEVLNTKLRSSGSLLNLTRDKLETEADESGQDVDKKIGKIIIKKIKLRRRKKSSRWTKSENEENTTRINDCSYAAKLSERKLKRRASIKMNGIIRKKRQSELMTLCDEAESFMFGESNRQANSSAAATGSDNRVKSCAVTSSPSAGRRTISSTSENKGEVFFCGGGGLTAPGKRRKKRRSHAEAFIHDNIDYYKFETPDSRLRYQNHQQLQSLSAAAAADLTRIPVTSVSESKSVKSDDFVYTFHNKRKKRTRRTEAAEEPKEPKICYKPRHLVRKASGAVAAEEIPTHVSSPASTGCTVLETGKKNSTQIPEEISNLLFSFESVPMTEPWYDVYKRQDEGMENYYPVLSDPNDEPFLLPYELPKPAFAKLVPDEASEYYKRKKRKFGHVLSNHPRKSPRCHASTLAILSSLKKRKRRSGTNISMSQQQQQQQQHNHHHHLHHNHHRHYHHQENPLIDLASVSSSNPAGCIDSIFESSFAFSKTDTESGALEKDYDDELNERIILEPLSDSESKNNSATESSCFLPKRQQDEEAKYYTSSRSRGRKLTKAHCSDSLQEGCKHFLYRNIETDHFFKDMIIETEKKSDLNINIVTMLENLKSYKIGPDATDSTADHSDFISDFDNGSSIADESTLRRKRKKCRKINKTGWDNTKKTRRNKLAVNKIIEAKRVTCDSAVDRGAKESPKTKAKANSSDSPRQEAQLSADKRVPRRVLDLKSQKNCQADDRTKTRSQQQQQQQQQQQSNNESPASDRFGSIPVSAARAAMTRRKTASQESEIHSRSESCDSRNSLEYSPCVVRVKKINQVPLGASVKLRCSNGRYSIQSKRLVPNRKKKRVMDYAWTTRKRKR